MFEHCSITEKSDCQARGGFFCERIWDELNRPARPAWFSRPAITVFLTSSPFSSLHCRSVPFALPCLRGPFLSNGHFSFTEVLQWCPTRPYDPRTAVAPVRGIDAQELPRSRPSPGQTLRYRPRPTQRQASPGLPGVPDGGTPLAMEYHQRGGVRAQVLLPSGPQPSRHRTGDSAATARTPLAGGPQRRGTAPPVRGRSTAQRARPADDHLRRRSARQRSDPASGHRHRQPAQHDSCSRQRRQRPLHAVIQPAAQRAACLLADRSATTLAVSRPSRPAPESQSRPRNV
jgi:hypothetical protein